MLFGVDAAHVGRGAQTLRGQLMSPGAQKQKYAGFCCAERGTGGTERVTLCETEHGELQEGVPRA